MKRLLTLATVLLSSSLLAAPIIVKAPVDHLFVPTGFDNNDNVELFVSGEFASSCYSRNKVDVKFNDDMIDVTVTALLNNDPEKNCEELKVPYMENVTLGSLQAGNYKVRVNNKLTDKLAIKEARSSSVDDYIYAPVDYIELGFTGGINGEVMLVGRSSECITFDRVEMISNNKDTLSVLPIMKVVSKNCANERTNFSIPVKFQPRAFANKNILLYVKTMDGKSVTTLMHK